MRQFALGLSVLLTIIGLQLPVFAQNTTDSALQSSNILNPNISAIGWFQAEAGHRVHDPNVEEPNPFELKEVEVAIQAPVDPYSKAEFIISFGDEGAEVEEGTLTWFALPANLGLKVGKFRANFGRFNRVHGAETAFADRPLSAEAFFGEEGLAGTGGSLSWQIPNPWLFLNLDAEVTSPEVEESPVFAEAQKRDLLYLGRLSAYTDLSEASNLTIGTNFARGPAGEEFDPIGNSSTTLNTELVGADMTFRWKNPRRAIYRSFLWQTEAIWSRKELSTMMTERAFGAFSHLEYQFARRWRTGGRYDFTENVDDPTMSQKGGLVYLTFTPSEFSLISLQGRHVTFDDGTHEDVAFLKTTYSVGPHGVHPF